MLCSDFLQTIDTRYKEIYGDGPPNIIYTIDTFSPVPGYQIFNVSNYVSYGNSRVMMNFPYPNSFHGHEFAYKAYTSNDDERCYKDASIVYVDYLQFIMEKYKALENLHELLKFSSYVVVRLYKNEYFHEEGLMNIITPNEIRSLEPSFAVPRNALYNFENHMVTPIFDYVILKGIL